jgi:hypothetical protein
MGPYYRGSSDSVGLYGSSSSFGGTYFEWFIFKESATAPATPTGGSWSFTTNVGTPPAGWSSTPPETVTSTVWASIALVNSKNTNALTWSVPGQLGGSSGSVTSVAATVPAFLSVTGSPITTSGTLAIGYSGTALPVANGGTGGTTTAAARSSLDAQQTLVSGTNIKTINSTSILGSGNLVVSGTPAGSTNQVQYRNSSGLFAASSSFTFSPTLLTITVNDVNLGRGGGSINTSTAVGASALSLSNASSSNNAAFGYFACNNNRAGANNTGVGSEAFKQSQSGNNNTAIGAQTIYTNFDGNDNTAVGYQALYSNITGDSNTALGTYALVFSRGSNNVGIGASALSSNTLGSNNIAIGNQALYINTEGNGNIMIGALTDDGSYSPVFDPLTQDNRISLGSTSVTNAYIQVAWTVVSDARDKTDFAPVPHGLDFVKQLQPTTYRYKAKRDDAEGHGPLRYGFKAQDVLALEGSNPVIVDAENSEKLRFNDQSLIAVLVNAIKELNDKFDAYVATHP